MNSVLHTWRQAPGRAPSLPLKNTVSCALPASQSVPSFLGNSDGVSSIQRTQISFSPSSKISTQFESSLECDFSSTQAHLQDNYVSSVLQRSFSHFVMNGVVVQSRSPVRLFVAPLTAARQVSLSFIISQNFLKLTSIESVMPSNHLILCRPLLLLPLIFPSIRVFSNEHGGSCPNADSDSTGLGWSLRFCISNKL